MAYKKYYYPVFDKPLDCSLSVHVRENEPLESALKRFRKKVDKSGKLYDFEAKQFYEPPSVVRKRMKSIAIKRWKRKVEETSLTPKKPVKKKKLQERKQGSFDFETLKRD